MEKPGAPQPPPRHTHTDTHTHTHTPYQPAISQSQLAKLGGLGGAPRGDLLIDQLAQVAEWRAGERSHLSSLLLFPSVAGTPGMESKLYLL